ncbi:hypothetical protein EG68_01167 [Paragonimus skrjabini miyazakii]|uniref:EF-hand domain-containing protein n=1 Tax=Paragonimus skrjabini miyazakii TaxID=59628 RepID=A0A8S9Z463_9TREM|nr:hypothetical protein EG68_01167 [Paragonimus skrjabini miyazakii]
MAYTASNLERMIEKFLELDTNKDDVVDMQELINSCKTGGLNMTEVMDWINKYDVNQDGKITLDEFCRGLGLKSAEMRIERTERKAAREGNARHVDPSIQIIASTMSPEKQAEVTDKFIELVSNVGNKPEEMNNVAKQLKTYLDSKYGRVWQAVILTGSYWMNFSHEPFMSVQFKHGPHICLAWRTPSG